MSRPLLSRSVLPALVLLFMVAACGTPAGSAGGDESQELEVMPTDREATAIPGGARPGAQPPVDGPLPDRRTGAVTFASTDSCPEPYSTAAVARRDFAFDGTVTAIEGAGSSSAAASLVTVSFQVHEWLVHESLVGESLVGEGTATVQVQMPAPYRPQHSESAPSYFVGTRLLVSGDDGTAWACGFTRYHDEDTAATWRS
jgi:hypothetical protein